ncbi:EF-hand domain-containing family member C2 [Anabrus simplex]|uniref:EF-hand domain-containing family member C2 n=1 Tax=Anabrus simplex TaxID=316456 RepID=UPI0035A3A5FA
MLRSAALPLLPGNCFNSNIGKTKFHRSQQFERIKNVPMLCDKITPGIGGVKRFQKYPSIFARGEVTDLPPWIVFDKQILCFDAYFQETAQEREGYAFHVRKCKIFFFLEDGTIKVSEPKVDNSGIPQGTLLSRQRIPFPPPRHADFYDIIDFNIGNQVEFYGRVFKITNCDRFTRVFLNRLGIHVPDPINMPDDPYKVNRDKIKDTTSAKNPSRKNDRFSKFLKYDRKVLRFFCYWDDRESEGGFLHHLELHYFLSDDTIEIHEHIPDNSGREGGAVFCRRARLPKVFKELPAFGHDSPFTVLNVLSSGFTKGGRFIADPLNCGMDHTEYYSETDLAIGASINCYGRQIILTDCDAFTKDYYRLRCGIEDFTPAEHPKAKEEMPCPMVERELPPYNGYGTFDDSAAHCLKMIPVAPQRDFVKFLKKDKDGFNSNILRFRASLISKNPDDNKRFFIISFFLCDDTISVNEEVMPNIGFQGGMFFSRNKIYKPGQELFVPKEPDIYTQDDFYVGNVLVLNDFLFMLMDADEYAYRYMEVNCHEFPKSNILLILEKLREALKPVYKDFVKEYLESDAKKCGVVPYCEMRRKLKEILGDKITEHEMITIARRYNARKKERKMDKETLRSIVHTELKRYLFNQFERLLETFRHMDPERTCFVDRKTAYFVCRAAKVPIDKALLNVVLEQFPVNEKCQINYMDLMQFLNYKECPASAAVPINTVDTFSEFKDIPPPPIGFVNYEALLKDLDLEKDLKNQSG